MTTSTLDETVDLGVISCSMVEDAQVVPATQSQRENIKGEWAEESSDEEWEASLLVNTSNEPPDVDFVGIHHQRLGETLAEYQDAIQTWTTGAYPQGTAVSREEVSREMFLDGLRDRWLAAQVRLKECGTLAEAYQRAAKFRLDRMKGELVPLVPIDGASKQAE